MSNLGPSNNSEAIGGVSPARRWAIAGLAVVGSIGVAGAVGRNAPGPGHAIVTVAGSLLASGLVPLAYVLAGAGYARALSPLYRRAADRTPLQLACGLAIMLTMSQLAGLAGLYQQWLAIATVAIGLGLLGEQVWRHRRRARLPRLEWPWLLGAPAIGLLFTAASMPPGFLWSSEFGGYDVLSYHLQLPSEWLRAGRLEVLDHNVYSYLPGSVEAAFAHVGAIYGLAGRGEGLVSGSGAAALAGQWLHAWTTLASGWLVARLAHGVLTRGHVGGRARALLAAGSGTIVVATPWAIVTGSMAYNEMALVALGSAALLAAGDRDAPRAARGALTGLLVGAACGAKMTAIVFVAPAAGVVLLAGTPARRWATAALPGAVAGALMLTPWMARNAAASGNPVFPHMARVFARGHWTDEQHRRYALAHGFDGSAVDRLRLLAWTDGSAEPGARAVQRWRGAANPQWGVLFVVATGGLTCGLWGRSTRRQSGVFAIALTTQLAAWLALTHLQSRFLLPCLPVLAVLGALGASRCSAGRRGVRTAGALVAGVTLVQLAFAWTIYGRELGGAPASLLGLPVEAVRGDADGAPRERSPEGYVFHEIPSDETVYLLGDATPLHFARQVLYNTTYDTWPLGDLIRADPDDPGAWTRGLGELGVAWVLVNPAELGRLHASGWTDPAITPERVGAWLDTLGRPEMTWTAPDGTVARALYRLREESDR